MKNYSQISLILALTFTAFVSNAKDISESDLALAVREYSSQENKESFINLLKANVTCENAEACRTSGDIIVQELDDLLRDLNPKDRESYLPALQEILSQNIETPQYLKLLKLAADFFPNETKSTLQSRELRRTIWSEQLTRPTALRIYALRDVLPKSYNFLIREIERRYSVETDTMKSTDWTDRYDIAKDLLISNPPIDKYASGKYSKSPRIYMFCRQNREYPCLMVLREPNGSVHREDSGEVWAHPALGYSRHKKEFFESSGNTPSGVFRIDGVMAEADQQLVFGKNRRMILNLVGASDDEINLKNLLPISTHDHQWWRESVVARDMGRGLFRIHGTGLRSSSFKPYFPFVATSGCIAQKENKYGKNEYNDQRELLDELMRVSGFDPVFDNESSIRALLYIINIDQEEKPVELSDLKAHGIL